MSFRCAPAVFAVLCLLGATGALAVGSESLVPSAQSALISRVELVNADLRVTVTPGVVGTVHLVNRQGAVLASAPLSFGSLAETVDSLAGPSTAVFSTVLPRLLSGSPLYRLRVVTAATPVVTVPEWPFGVSLACTETYCRPSLSEGVAPGTGTRWARPELTDFLATVPPGRGGLEAALAAGLIGPALDFARVVSAEPYPVPGTCQCKFTFSSAGPARELCGANGLQVAVEAKGVSGERRIEAHRLHAVTLELPLHCYQHGLPSVYRTTVESGTWKGVLEVPMPNLLPCSRPCLSGQPNYHLSAAGQVDVSVVNSDEDALADASWEVRATPQAGAIFRATDSEVATGSNSAFQKAQTVVWAGGANRLDVEVDLRAGVTLPGKDETAEASAWVNLTVAVEAASVCSDVERGAGSLALVAAENSEDMLDPTQISILIGGGCRP